MDLAAEENSDSHCIFLMTHPCPLGCGKRIMGKQMEEHVTNLCRKRRLHCPHGCGELVLAGDLQEHTKSCPMSKILARADSAIEFLSLRDLNDAVKDIYGSRGQIRKNLAKWGQMPQGKGGWGSEQSADKIRRLQRSQTELATKLRAQREDKVQQILARMKWKKIGFGGAAAASLPSLMKPNLMKAISQAAGAKERLRKKVFEPVPEIVALADAIVALQEVTGNEQLQLRAEEVLLDMLKDKLDAAVSLKDSDGLHIASTRVRELLPTVKIADKTEVLEAVMASGEELHAACIKACPFNQEFWDAVLQSDLDTCGRMLAKEQANPSAPDPKPPHLTPLIVATKNGDLQIVEFLLLHGADVNVPSTDGFTALHWAGDRRQEDLMLLLLSFQANPMLKDKRGHDPMMKLLRRRDINRPPSFSWDIRKDITLPGKDLARSGQMTVSQAQDLCIANSECFGFHFKPREEEGALPQRALQISLRPRPPPEWGEGENPGETSRRSSKIISPDKRRSIGSSAAGSAKKSKESVPETGADAGSTQGSSAGFDKARNSRVSRGETAENEGSKGSKGTASSKDARRNSNKKSNDDGWWTYIKVVSDSQPDLRALLQFKADAGATDVQGLTALHHHLRNAPQSICLEAVEMLLEANADVNVKDKTLLATTPFLLAIKSHRMDVVNTMIKKAHPPPDVDARALDGVTACRSAIRPGSPTQVIKELRQRGATDWADTTLALGGKTMVHWDTRNVIDPVPLDPNVEVPSSPKVEETEKPEKTEKKENKPLPAKKPPVADTKEKNKESWSEGKSNPEKSAALSEFEKWIVERYEGDFKKTFKSLDHNGSGSITKSEFNAALSTANFFDEGLPGRRRQDADAIFRMMDENGGGDITVREFGRVMKEGINKRMKEEGLN